MQPDKPQEITVYYKHTEDCVFLCVYNANVPQQA